MRITKTNRKDYDEYLMGQLTMVAIQKKRNIDAYELRKIFEYLYREKKIEWAKHSFNKTPLTHEL